MPDSLVGSTAIISGGLGDIGRAIALDLAVRGADIAIGDLLDQDRASALLSDLKRMGRKARYDRVDVSYADQVQEWLTKVERAMAVPDLVIPNAAVVNPADIRTLAPGQWARELQVNLNGAFYLAQAGALAMLRKGIPGRIVFVGSWEGHAPQIDTPSLCVSKAAIRMLCQCMALDLAPDGILVNEVSPGYVDAGVSRRIFSERPDSRSRAVSEVPVGGLAAPDEVAWQVAHLCSPENRQMSGAVILMDGGLSLVRGRNWKREPE